jgi:hypothetical protein
VRLPYSTLLELIEITDARYIGNYFYVVTVPVPVPVRELDRVRSHGPRFAGALAFRMGGRWKQLIRCYNECKEYGRDFI